MSKKQSIIADSSTAAEFIGAHTGAQAIMWARNFLEELGFQQNCLATVVWAARRWKWKSEQRPRGGAEINYGGGETSKS